jgi:ATP-dependent RNA helicase DOB1
VLTCACRVVSWRGSLEELMRQLGDCAKSIGDSALEEKFREAGTKMRRDIIFAASLYL